MVSWTARLCIACALLFACSSLERSRGVSLADRSADAVLAEVERMATGDARLATLVAARDGAFQRAPESTEDQESRGRIVSEGWRSTKEKRFGDLGARLPDFANGSLDVGVSRFERMRVQVTLEGAASTTGVLTRGRVVYANAFAGTDRVLVSSATALEELLVLASEKAPRAFTWKMQLPDGVARVVERDGGLVFEDPRERALLTMPAPHAIDGHGSPVALDTTWDGSAHTLRVALRALPHAWPVMIDPKYEENKKSKARNPPSGARFTYNALCVAG